MQKKLQYYVFGLRFLNKGHESLDYIISLLHTSNYLYCNLLPLCYNIVHSKNFRTT
jgi:hypothetical protein